MNEFIITQALSLIVAILVAYGFDKWAEYKAFLRTRENLHNWSRSQRDQIWDRVNEVAESDREPWQKALNLKVEAELAQSSIFFAIDNLRINYAHRITAAIQKELQAERMFWQQAGALFTHTSGLLREGLKAGDTEQQLIEKHVKWVETLIQKGERLDALTKASSRNATAKNKLQTLSSSELRASLDTLFGSTVPYYVQRVRKEQQDNVLDQTCYGIASGP